MDAKRTHFIEVWQSSPSLEAAASILGMKVRSVTRQANRLKALGVPLKSLTDPRFNPHANRREKRPLTNDERAFMAEHYQFALRMAYSTCRTIDLPPQWAEDMVEDAAAEGLLLIARRSSEPGFVSETVKGLIFAAVRCQVIAMMKKLLGPVRASPIIAEIAPAQGLTPLQEAILREGEAQMAAAKALVGGIPNLSTWRRPQQTKEHHALKLKARQLNLSTEGTTDELRERLAAHYRTQLVQYSAVDARAREQEGEHERPEVRVPPPVEQIEQESMAVPTDRPSSRISQYLSPPPQPKSRQQLEAERFIIAWYQCGNAADVALKLNRSVKSVMAYAARLRRIGVKELKRLPAGPEALIRGVRSLIPSLN